MKDRGQTEIMGLAIVIILITLGVLFALTTMRDEDPAMKQEFEQANIANGFLKTFLKTNVPCGNDIMRQILKTCVEGGSLECPPELDPRGQLESADACEYVNRSLEVIMQRTLDIRGSKYWLGQSQSRNPAGWRW